LVCAAGPLPLCDLRIRAKRPGAIDRAARAMRRDELIRRDVLVHPFIESAQRVELIGSRATAAVTHPRHHEETCEFARLVDPAHRARDTLVVVHEVTGRYERVGPAGVHDEPAAPLLECAEIWIHIVHDRTELRVDRCLIVVEIEGWALEA